VNSMSALQVAAITVTALYGIVSLVGGTIGYINKGSIASIVAGGIAGVLLLICAVGVPRLPAWSLGGAMLIALLLAGRFAGTLMKSQDSLGETLSKGPGITAVVMIVGGVLVLIVSALALAMGSQPRQ
jgi:uncharacterized membrane protein (UPF0136 family)